MEGFFCPTCGVIKTMHDNDKCKELSKSNSKNGDFGAYEKQQPDQPKRGWVVAYFQRLEDEKRLPNLYVYKVKRIVTIQGHTRAMVQKGTNCFTGIYVPFGAPYVKNGEKQVLALSQGDLYYDLKKMPVKHKLTVPIEHVLRLSRDNVPVLEDKLEARLNDEWCLERDDSRQIVKVIKKGMEF